MLKIKTQKADFGEDPIQLKVESDSIPELPESLIPEIVRPWVLDVADRMQVSPESIMAPHIVLKSSIIGTRLGVCPKQYDNWFVTPNLWGVLIADPGYMKSPIVGEVISVLRRVQEQIKAEYEKDLPGYVAADVAVKAEIEGLKARLREVAKCGNSDEESELKLKLEDAVKRDTGVPCEKRLSTNDATIEKLSELLNERKTGIFLWRDELNGFLNTLMKQGKEGDTEYYLESWTGNNPFVTDRIGRGTTYVDKLCIAIFGGIQPIPYIQFVKKNISGEKNDGMAPRFQVAILASLRSDWENVDRPPDSEAKQRVEEHFFELENADFLSMGHELSGETPYLRFSGSARPLFDAWRKELESRIRCNHEHPAYRQHLSKFRSLLPSLALIFQLDDDVRSTQIGRTAMIRAAGWCDYLEWHARAIYQKAYPETTCLRAFAERVLDGSIRDGMTIRCIQRKNWSGIKGFEMIQKVVRELEDLNWIKMVSTDGVGRGTKCLFVHPLIQSGKFDPYQYVDSKFESQWIALLDSDKTSSVSSVSSVSPLSTSTNISPELSGQEAHHV